MKELTAGERAYDLAVSIVELTALVDPRPLLNDCGRCQHSFDNVSIIADFDRTSARTEWRVLVEVGGARVLDVVYDTNPCAGQCKVVTVVPGAWEESLAAEESRVAAALAGPAVF